MAWPSRNGMLPIHRSQRFARRACLALAALSVAAAAPAPASAAASFNCDASALRGTVLTTAPIEPAVANRGQQSCKPARATITPSLGALPLGLSAIAGAAQTNLEGPADRVDQQKASAVGGIADLRVGALPELPITLPTASLPTVPPIAVTLPLMLGTASVDVNAAIQALLPAGKLPTLDLVRVQTAIAYASASCQAGKAQLAGASQVAGISVLGTELPVGQVVDQTLSLIDSASIDPSNIDLSKVVVTSLPFGVSLSTPGVTDAINTAVDLLPTIEIPATLAQVKVTPGGQVRSGDKLTQQALRVQVSIAGQKLADLVVGEASVSATAVSCSPAASVAGLALQCTTRKLVLVDVLQRGRHVKLLGAADRKYIGRKVSIRFTATGRRVATAVVRKDGSFQTTAPLPKRSLRGTNRARYQASIGKERSLRLKLKRRMIVSSLSSKNGKVTIAGRVLRPLATPIKAITVTRRVSCKRNVVVKRIKPSRSGRFRVTVDAPPSQLAAVYRLGTRVRKNTHNRKLFPTFTLPRAVEIK